MKKERISIHISICKNLSRKIRVLVTTLPGSTLNSYIETLFEKEIEKYEDVYGDISAEEEMDFYFDAPRNRGRRMRSLDIDLE